MQLNLPKPHQWQQAGLTVLVLALMLTLESKAAVGAWHSVIDHIAAIQHAALSITCSLMGVVLAGVASAMARDERPGVRSQAATARLISIALMFVPIGYLGSSFKMDRQASEWAAYSASPALAADTALANDMSADVYEREEARERIQEPTTAKLDILDFEFWLAAFFQIGLIGAASVRIPAPITAEERDYARRVLAAKKGLETRKRNKAKKAKAAPKKGFRVFAGGKSA